MCTRFYIMPETEEFKEIIAAVKESPLFHKFIDAGKPVLTSGEIRPTDVVPVVASNREGVRTVFPMKWGFRLSSMSLLVNAKSETAAEKPTFKEAWFKHRCIIPASWYYEWEHFVSSSGLKKTGAKYTIQPRDSQMSWLCGLYRIEDGMPAFTVLTREPSDELRRIHDRMPLLLPEEKIGEWIDPANKPEELMPFSLTDMLFEKTK